MTMWPNGLNKGSKKRTTPKRAATGAAMYGTACGCLGHANKKSSYSESSLGQWKQRACHVMSCHVMGVRRHQASAAPRSAGTVKPHRASTTTVLLAWFLHCVGTMNTVRYMTARHTTAKQHVANNVRWGEASLIGDTSSATIVRPGVCLVCSILLWPCACSQQHMWAGQGKPHTRMRGLPASPSPLHQAVSPWPASQPRMSAEVVWQHPTSTILDEPGWWLVTSPPHRAYTIPVCHRTKITHMAKQSAYGSPVHMGVNIKNGRRRFHQHP